MTAQLVQTVGQSSTRSLLKMGCCLVALAMASPATAQEQAPLLAGPLSDEDVASSPSTSNDRAASDAAGDSEIVVTGSRIQRRDASAVGPLTTLTSQDIAFTAPTSVGDLLQALPSVGVSLNSNGTQGTSFGVSSINLRYLGSAEGSGNRTLVLVDGHRFVNAVGGRGFRDFVDLNTIPLGIIDRIEVLKDGASAIYGADAIAGVVNIRTKRRLEGLETSARVGITDRGDNENYSGYLNWGARSDRLSVLLSASYNDTKPILTSDRALTERALTPLTAPPASNTGLFILPRLGGNAYFGTPAAFATAATAITPIPGSFGSIGAGSAADNSFRVATLPADDFNPLTQGLYSTGPSERLGLFGRVGYEIADNLEARVEALYSWRKSQQRFSPTTLDIRGANGFLIAADQQFNPFGTANGVPVASALAFGADSSVPAATRAAFRIRRFTPEVGNRDNTQKIDTYRLAAGLDGSLDLFGEWTFDAFASYSKNKADFVSAGGLNLENVFRGLQSPTVCTAAVDCVPLNLFGPLTPAQADFIRFVGIDRQSTEQINAALNVGRNLFELPGGPLGLAAGYEFRRESAVDTPDPIGASLSNVLPLVGGVRQAPTTAVTRSPTIGSYNVHEVYAEVNAPLLKDLPLIHSLDVDAAIRYSEYNTVGGKATTKFGVAYRPVEDLLLRGTYSQGFRAPSILELFQSSRDINFQGIDPCNGGGAGKVGCAGVPATYNQAQFNNGLIRGVTAGNQDLEAETADTYSLGLAFTPQFARGFSLTADWFEIKVQDAIGANSATNILDSCASTGVFCNLVQRNSLGEITRLTQSVVNLSRIDVSGIDVTARYAFGTGIGRFEAAVDVSYLDKFRTLIPQPDGSTVIDDRAGKSDRPRSTFPRWKGQASLRYSSDGFDAGWKTRYIGSSDDIPNNPVNGGKLTDVFYHDLQIGYTLPDTEINFALGVDNVFDRQPPASAANNPINFDIYTYDVRGRYLYARATFKM